MKRLFILFCCISLTCAAFAYGVEIDGIYYLLGGDTAIVTYTGAQCYDNNTYSGSISIPTSVTYQSTTYSVTTIGDWAFRNCSGLTSVTIPNSVTTIGNEAFAHCGMTSITIPNSITTIGDEAFRNCSGLTSITIPNSVTTIGSGAFFECSGLTMINVDAANTHYCSIDGVLFNYAKDTLVECPMGNTRTQYTIPNSVTTIGKLAFAGCGLTSVAIPNSVTTIGVEAFGGCSGLTSVTIPDSVTTIGNSAFYNCSGLTSVTIPNSVTTIGRYAFYDCYGLTSVTIGNSVTTIGEDAFDWCTDLTSITCYAVTPPECVGSVFRGISQDAKVYVPASALVDYQSAEVWKDMLLLPIAADVTPMDDENPIVTPTDQDVTITWAITDGTDTYTLTISQNGETVCVLTFNANGQLINIAFAAPGHNGVHQAPAATLTAQGYQFTVTGLTPGTDYTYSVTATDAGGQTIAEHKGNFSTTGSTPMSINGVHDSQCTIHKVLNNGQILLKRNNATYTLMGQKVK